ncbi:MAG: VWA domain-containing protein, partial [Candidatus Kapabacteria bacterium]|nr:VWA domain-containing protein [Candidatus Kapabacteria bacterium]
MQVTLYLLLIIISSATASSQSLSVFNIDTSAFPVIRAKFFAFDAAGNQIRNLTASDFSVTENGQLHLTASDFSVTENGQLRSVLSVSCPAPKPPVALSSVLVMDQSGSMSSGNKLDLIHKATKSWIDALPGRSECAITSFDNENYIVQDFTTNKTLLEQKEQSITANGGTDYNKAMIDPMSSGIDIVKTGKYRRVIVMLSDGLPNFEPRTSQIINEAKANSIIIYFVSLGYPSPQCMKDITKQTGGQYFENVSSVEDAKKVYMKIMQAATGGEPCDISWTSGFSCRSNLINVDLKVNSLNLAATAIYQSTNNSIATLVFNPSTIVFKNVLPGNTKDSTVHITARNADFNVSDIKIS